MDKERRNRKGREEERNSPVAAFSQPTGLVPVATGFWKKKSSSANHLHLDLLSAPVTHPVSVTNSNKHPNLITQLPLNPAVSEENQKKKNHPQQSSCGVSFPSIPRFPHLWLIVTRHMCVHTRSCQTFRCGLQAM